MMNINPDDIDQISIVGRLNGDDVKIIKTTGGFHIAVGRRAEDDSQSTVLGGGSHKGLVVHHIQKDYPSFQQDIFKSSTKSYAEVTDVTKFLSDLSKNNNIEMFLTKSGDGSDKFIFSKYGVIMATYEKVNGEVINTFKNRKK